MPFANLQTMGKSKTEQKVLRILKTILGKNILVQTQI